MRRFIVAPAVAALAALCAAVLPAHAAGVQLRWGSCQGASNRNFACDENEGVDVLVASFSPPGGIGPVTGVAAYGHISAAASNVPPWWQLGDGCRNSSLSASFSLNDQTECDDPWGGQGMGGIAFVRADGQGLDFLVAVAVPQSQARDLASGRTYAAFKLVIDHQLSTGNGCAGCQAPVCVSMDRMSLGQIADAGYRDVDLTQAIPSFGAASNVATWQGGTSSCGAGGVKRSTWGTLKGKFR